MKISRKMIIKNHISKVSRYSSGSAQQRIHGLSCLNQWKERRKPSELSEKSSILSHMKTGADNKNKSRNWRVRKWKNRINSKVLKNFNKNKPLTNLIKKKVEKIRNDKDNINT